MAQDSKRKRYIRRLKRQNTLMTRITGESIRQRDEARMVANAVIKELEAREKKETTFKLTKVDNEQSDQTAGPLQNGN